MGDAIIGLSIVFGIGLIAQFAIMRLAVKSISEAWKRESESSGKIVAMFHKASQVATFNATVTKNERLEAAYIELEGERLRFGAPPPVVPPTNYYNPNEIAASDMQSSELRTVSASGTGVD